MTTTVAQAHRQLVAEMDEAGDPPEVIAKKLGISVDRVEAILDQLDEGDGRPAHPDDEYRAPAVEPIRPEPRPVTESGPIMVGSPARAPKVNAAKRKSAVDWPKPSPRKPRTTKPPVSGEVSAATDQVRETRPAGAVAHLSLPLAVPALVAVADALELAYGPGLSVSPADGGVWVLRRAS